VIPLVSILIPAYNAQAWIRDALASTLEQTWERKEIIVVDDGSTDQTLAVAREFECARVKIETQRNQGASAARNTALSLCQGDYIQWLDADDLLAPDKVATQLAHARHTAGGKTLLSSAWGTFRRRIENTRFAPNVLWRDHEPVDWLIAKFQQGAWMALDSWLISRELTKAAGEWDVRLLRDNDGDYISRVVCAAERIHFVPEAKSFIRRGTPGSISSDFNLTDRRIESVFLAITQQIGYLRSLEDSARTRSACLAYLQQWLVYFYHEREDLVAKAMQLASELGGELHAPSLPWKYEVIRKLFGWRAAKRAKATLPRIRARFLPPFE